MKKILLSALMAASPMLTVRAQDIVYDPIMNAQQIVDTAQQIAKQVEQIKMLTDQLNEFKHYEDLFGDPKTIVLPMVSALNADLLATEPGKNLESLVAVADGHDALTYDGSGLYVMVGASFLTPGGKTIARSAADYKPFAAINRTADNFVAVADDAATRRAALKNRISQTTEQLKSAPTDAEVQKLQGVLTSLNADLASTDAEVNQAIGSALVQDIQNRNEIQKQQRALLEQEHAEFHEAVTNYVKTFRLLNEPTLFPTP